MKRVWFRLFRACVGLGMVWLSPGVVGVASAQSEATVHATSSDDVARGLFQAGRASYGVGKYEDALRYFQQAYELSQRPGLLYNIGQAADRLHRDALTVEVFRLYLERVPHTEHRLEVESRLRALERLVEFEASQGTQRAASADPDATQASLGTADKSSRGPGPAPWLLVVGGGATLISGAVIGWIGARQIADVEQAADGSRWADAKSAADSGPTLATLGIVLLSVGAVVTTSGVVWLLSAGEEESALSLGVHPTGVVLAGSL